MAKTPSPLVVKLAERWVKLLRQEREIAALRKACQDELTPYVRPLGEIALEDGSAVTLERASHRVDCTLGRLIMGLGHDAANAFWKTLPEKTTERLHLREPDPKGSST